MVKGKDKEAKNATETDVAKAVSEELEETTEQELSPEDMTTDDWLAQLGKRDAEIKELNDRLLRTVADVENTRKRLERERSEGIAFANECFIREMLTIADNLERAVEHAEQDANAKSLLEGVQMTHKALIDTLGRFGCTPFESLGKEFDPNFHNAVFQEENADHPENTVVKELQRGYLLKDRLLRPAMVVVSKAPKSEDTLPGI